MVSRHTFKKTHHNLYEKQKFRNIYMLFVLFSIEVTCIYILAIDVLKHKPFIISSFPNWPLAIFTLALPTPLLLIFTFTRLETIFNEDGIFYRWMPYKKRYQMIQWDAIRQVSMISLEKEGFSLRFSKKYDKIHHADSKAGIVIVMRSGKKHLIGTSKPEALNRVLVRIIGSKYQPSSIGENYDYSD